MSQNMTNEQFWDHVARGMAALFVRIPTEYPALEARIQEGRRQAALKASQSYIGDNSTEQALNPSAVSSQD